MPHQRPLPVILIAAILCCGIFTSIPNGTISVILPGISDHFHNGSNGIYIKMVVTALGVGMMLGSPLGGLIADRIGYRPVLVGASVILCLAGASVLLAEYLGHVILARFIMGGMAGAINTCMVAVISEAVPDKSQSRWLGYAVAAGTFSVFILSPLTGVLSDTGWRNGFSIYVIAIPMVVLLFLGVPQFQIARPLSSKQHGTVAGLFDDMPWSGMMLALVVGTLATGTSLYWPFRLREVGIDSATKLALYALPNAALVGVSAFFFGTIRRYLDQRWAFVLSGLASGAGLLAMALSNSAGVIMLGLALEGAAIGVLMPNLSSYALATSREIYRARNVGLIKGAVFGSPFITQFLLEPINGAGGSRWALASIAIMAFAMALILMLVGCRPSVDKLSRVAR
ncbi:putative major facilitator superfamily transporter [Caenibius tardaugens NBRC 16725]|uniref:Putative major facilitator superfamily transporter n=1 Tax=Caenibius tardaugens NBRC 16725 TaxID=1219035 RepID=U2YQ17_9SPHN|nr:MFS transporter [Caenibius tardaugens]AZI35359.1 MFS transporter [Caenibius tardaugens NBRC 16725]GAD51040.1 putative major facilitator superfamily transporter [Caenibius tardaugens NBRC 16725]